MMCPRVALHTVFIGCYALLITYSQQAESVSSNEIDSDSNVYTAQSTDSRTSPFESSNQHTSEILKPSQIRNRRSNSLNSGDFNEDIPGLNSAFLYSDQIMQNLLNSQSPRPLNYARSNFFLNLLKPRTTRLNSWDDHSLMHFGKRSIEDDKVIVKRSMDSLAPDNVLHFGKKSEEDNSEQNSRLLNMEFPNFGMELVQEDPANEDMEHPPTPNDVDQNDNNDAQPVDIDKKSGDPWHNMMSFGKKSEGAWDHSTLHFGKKDDPWHNMMSFGKKSEPWHNVMSFGKKSEPWHNIMSFGKRSENPWDHSTLHFGKRDDPWHNTMSFGKKSEGTSDNATIIDDKRNDSWHNVMSFGKKFDDKFGDHLTLHFGKREEPWHNVMSFGKKSDNSWEHSTLHFGKRDEPWHNMMSFGKKSDNPWDHSTLHFGKRDEPWHNMMSFGKKSDNPWDHSTLHFGKRDEPWHNMMSFGKKSDNPWDHSTLHFGKRDEPWHNMMSFGKKSDNPWDHSTLHFGKRDEPWHNMMSFGKKSDNPWDHSTLHFGKRDEPWHNMMSFGKKSDNPWDHSTLHFGKRDEPWHNMMSFGKKSDSPWDHSTLHFGKRDEPWHNMMSFGKKSDNPWDHSTLHFGKRDEPWHNMMSFGKKSDNPWDHSTLHFGKRDEPWHNMMSFGKKSDNPWDHSTLHFGKRDEPWHNMMSFGKRSDEMIANDQEDSQSHLNPWEDYSAMIFYKKSNPWDHSTLHFGKRSNDSSDTKLSGQKTSDLQKHVRKRSIDEWNNHHAMHFGKKSDLFDDDILDTDKKSDWDAHNTLHFGKKRNPWEYHNTMHFGKRDPWESHNTMHFGKRDPWDNHNTMHFGKRDPWDNHNTMHFGKRDPWDSHNTMHFGKRDPWDSHNTMHFGKRSNLNKLHEGTETEQTLQGSKSERKENELEYTDINKEAVSVPQQNNNHESAAIDSKNKVSVSKRSTEYIENNMNLKNKENEDKLKLGTASSNQDSLRISRTKDEQGTKNNILGATQEQDESASNDNQSKQQQNSIIGRSLKSIENTNKISSQFPASVNVNEEIISKSGEMLENEKVKQMTDSNAVMGNDPRSRINKRSAKTGGEKYETMDSNDRSIDDYSENEVPETVLHFGKRSLDDFGGSNIENIPVNLQVEDKRYDDWDNHNTMHFGKRDPWDHSTLHFGKRNPWDHSTMHFGKRDPWNHGTMHFGKRDPWDHTTLHFGKRDPWDHSTMHFGKRDPWDHSTLHFGKRAPWDHNTMHFGKRFDPWQGHQKMNFGKRSSDWDHNVMHFGKREGNEIDDGLVDVTKTTFDPQKLKDLLDAKRLQSSINNPNFRFLPNVPNEEKNDEVLENNPETDINNPLNEKSISYSIKYNLLKSYLKPILKNFLSGQDEEVIQSYSSPESEENNKDVMNDFDPIGYEDYSEIQNSENLGENGLPVENEERYDGTLDSSPKLVSYFTDYKEKRNLFGKPELKRYFGPFQGPKSIVYPHAWFASQIRRSASPKNTDFTRSFDLRMAEKKEDPFNSYMHFGRR